VLPVFLGHLFVLFIVDPAHVRFNNVTDCVPDKDRVFVVTIFLLEFSVTHGVVVKMLAEEVVLIDQFILHVESIATRSCPIVSILVVVVSVLV